MVSYLRKLIAKMIELSTKGKNQICLYKSNLKYNVFDDVGVQNTDSLPVIRATFCLIFGIFVGFQKSHRFISYFNLLHTAAWGPDGDCSFCCRLLLDLFILIAKFLSQLSTRIEEVQLGLVPFSLQLIYSIFSTVLTIVF